MKNIWFILTTIIMLLCVFLGYTHYFDNNYYSADDFASLSYFGIVSAALCSCLLCSRIKLTHHLRNFLIWTCFILILMVLYNARYEFQDLGYKLTAGLIPASPVTSYNENGMSVHLERMASGHFETRALVNGQTIQFMVDTGASSIVLSYEDAQKIGINVRDLRFNIDVNTANGETTSAASSVQSIKIGAIERDHIPVLISQPRAMRGSLLGMNFLDRLSGYSVRGDRMILVD